MGAFLQETDERRARVGACRGRRHSQHQAMTPSEVERTCISKQNPYAPLLQVHRQSLDDIADDVNVVVHQATQTRKAQTPSRVGAGPLNDFLLQHPCTSTHSSYLIKSDELEFSVSMLVDSLRYPFLWLNSYRFAAVPLTCLQKDEPAKFFVTERQ